MAPTPAGDVHKWLGSSITSSKVLVFSKTTCPFCDKLKAKLDEVNVRHAVVDIDKRSNCAEIQSELLRISGCRTVPQVFIRGNFVGGYTDIVKLIEENNLQAKVDDCKYDYDMVIIGGGSGGLAASKEAAKLGAKVAVLDYVEPTPQGTTWGLGGTCVNVGCIPKKLMHTSAILKHCLEDASKFGWNLADKHTHTFPSMVQNVQDHIRSLNWGYRVSLRSSGVTYLNAFGQLKDEHSIVTRNKGGEEKVITAETIVLATGERPRYLNAPGSKELCITSDDLFSLSYDPGKTLIVGASYVALECAGFLSAFGYDTTVMVRSILLRGFDQQMANMAGKYMESHGTKFIRSCVPFEFKEVEPRKPEENKPGLIEVTAKYDNGEIFKDQFNTVILAIGRDPCTNKINLQSVGVQLDKAGRVICDDAEQSSVPNIYAIGDIVSEKLQLTPVAIQAGVNLARRLYGAGTELTDYTNVATTVFTPLEYGAVGLSEETAIAKFGEKNIEVYHSFFQPLEWTVAHRENNVCYAKAICNKLDNDRILGMHILCPNAGEVIQGFAIAFKLGATKADLDRVIGIHPTVAEVFTTLKVTKSSGAGAESTGC